ncbi:hypothetical protein L484_017125 [Morus notabilis]|uniref:Uncharacterized protein n=1 Tax=Morus notabilis TaxID=981085 RepID=W9R7C1_9ROSA|nr:hypothetical protein L484_017125 [Morus notabilis]
MRYVIHDTFRQKVKQKPNAYSETKKLRVANVHQCAFKYAWAGMIQSETRQPTEDWCNIEGVSPTHSVKMTPGHTGGN